MFDLQSNKTEYISELKTALIAEYDAFYKKYREHHIYAFSLVLDEFLSPQYTTVSTEKSLLTEQENKFQYLPERDKWLVEKWQYRHQIDGGINYLSHKMATFFQQSRLSLTQTTSVERDQENMLIFYLEAMRAARSEIFQLTPKQSAQVLFFIWKPTSPEFSVKSLEALNTSSSLLYEAIASLKSQQIVKPKTKLKLTTIEKDLLIDLAQALEIEPYDDMEIAQHAYMLSLEPYFLEISPYIQHLINDIAAMDSGELVLQKWDIQARIQQFYNI